MREVATLAFLAILSGGLFGALASIVRERAGAKKAHAETDAIESKLPAEVDSIAVQGAQTAVLAMREALDAATERIATLERTCDEDRARFKAERDTDRERIRELEMRVAIADRKARQAQAAATDAQNETATLRAALAAYLEQRDPGP